METKIVGICEYCGKPYQKKAPHQKYCEECRDEARRRDNKARRRQKLAEARKEQETRQVKKDNLCKKVRTCIYGQYLYDAYTSAMYCNYIGITGHRRGCKPSECKNYHRKTRKGDQQ